MFKLGDIAILHVDYFENRIVKIVKENKVTVKADNGELFYKKDGFGYGTKNMIREATESKINYFRFLARRRELSSLLTRIQKIEPLHLHVTKQELDALQEVITVTNNYLEKYKH